MNSIKFLQITSDELSEQDFKSETDMVVFVVKEKSRSILIDHHNLKDSINAIFSSKNLIDIIFISKADEFGQEDLIRTLSLVCHDKKHLGITLLIPYRRPPVSDSREDGSVNSCIVQAKFCSSKYVIKYAQEFWKLLYYLTYSYLNTSESKNLEIVQVGKRVDTPGVQEKDLKGMLNKSMLLIPHKGTISLLSRCLLHVNQSALIPKRIKICFDDNSYKQLLTAGFSRIKNRITMSFNKPSNLGPYLGRHYSIINTKKEYIFFQDSDDISVNSRFSRQLDALTTRRIDLIGSHELRIDQFARCLSMVRFPVDVNHAFSSKAYQPLFHPTSMITRGAYLKTKGFSTNMRFGYDLQLSMRAAFYLKMGNIDDFLYIRFKRPGSLTTHNKTKLGSSLRSFLWWRWRVDMRLIQENKLNLEDSSLSVQKHEFDYEMIDIKQE